MSSTSASADSGLSRPARLIALSLAMLSLSACEEFSYPRDPNRTLEKVLAADRMRVVAVDHVPWVILEEDGVPKGAEVDLVEAFARDLGVTIEWRRAPTFQALEALKRGDAEITIGGFTRTAISAHKGASHTYPYFTAALIVATEPGSPVPQELDGLRVHVDPELMADGLVEDRGGVPVPEKTDTVRFVALPDWKVPAQGLVPTGIVLHREKHVMAVPQGENAWIMRLERFLREHGDEIGAMLREYAP